MKPCSDFSLAEWLDHLEQRHTQEIQLGLERVAQVARQLDLLQTSAVLITVAGTNGKGSTVASLESIYRSAGYQVGSYTSPHLFKFNERIKINQQAIGDEALCEAFLTIEQGRGAVPLTYFEMATLAALWIFKKHSLDLIILEVGLGGRLDATNIIDSDLAIITTIDLDHQDYLGDTREAIGYEKAGILRQGKPMIFADDDPVESIIEQIELKQVPAYFLNRDYSYSRGEGVFYYEVLNPHPQPFSLKGEGSRSAWLMRSKPRTHFDLAPFALMGEGLGMRASLHGNAIAAALTATLLLNDQLPVSNEALHEGLNHASLPGRLQMLQGDVSILIDVSHNPQSVRHLASHIEKLKPTGRIHAIFSALDDKDIHGMIAPMANCVKQWYIAPIESKRAASKQRLLTVFEDFDKIPLFFDRLTDAYYKACNQAVTGDLIVIYGSFLTVGALMGVLPLS